MVVLVWNFLLEKIYLQLYFYADSKCILQFAQISPHLVVTLKVEKRPECCECLYCGDLQELIFMITITFSVE